LVGKKKLYSIFVELPKHKAHPMRDLEPGDLDLVPQAEEIISRSIPYNSDVQYDRIEESLLAKQQEKFTSPALNPRPESKDTEMSSIPTDINSRQTSSIVPSQEDASEVIPVSKYHELKFKFLAQDPISQGVQGTLRRWKAGQLLGNGRMGNVLKAMDVKTGELFAIKRLFFDPLNEGQTTFVQTLEAEVLILQKLSHPNIVQFLGSECIGDSLCVYLEYLPGKSLANLVDSLGPLSETLVKIYLRDVLAGLKYLHENHVVHRDIKGANLLLDSDGSVRVADFGCSAQMDNTYSHSDILTSLKGSLPWMAPEVIKQTGHGRKADIWSLGCVTIELLSGKPPWQDFENQLQAIMRVGLSNDIPDIPEGISAEAADFILKCVQRNPKQRPSASELLTHPFIMNL
jgi:hypothetical protein